ncbi:MAG: dehydrogenase [Gammaproteobacteria bacterium RIFCSPHIGHO2_12_38_15]|nr:MAG: dehydrogenase [Gammaproteobacteria bacterium RIFCSPHIGHO2_12_38_15]
MKFRAAILVELNKPLVIEEIELASHLEYGQVLVKVICSGICGSQIGEIEGVKGPDKYLPHLLGHEGGGIVVDVGPGVKKVKASDHVVMHWRKGHGVDAPTPKYKWGDQTVNAGYVTTFNEYAVVSENRVTSIPKEVDFESAALMGCAILTGVGVVNNDAQIKVGQSVVIFGMGGLGLNIAQAATLVSAHPIIGIDLFDDKLEFARKFGLTQVINAAKENDISSVVKSYVGEGGADVVIDTTGNTRVIEQAYALTHHAGKTILVGVPKLNHTISIYSLPLHFNKTLKGSFGGNAMPDEDIPRYLKLLKIGKIQSKDFVSHHMPLSQINEAISLLQNGKALGRVMIDVAKL